MAFTPLHRLLGLSPGELNDDIIDAAVAAQVEETDDLDWKSKLPEAKGITTGEFPKDIAAMANSGGGIIVYGVNESHKKVTSRTDVGDFTQEHERSLRSAAVSAISPPIFGLDITRIGYDGKRCVAVAVPPSVDGPHLIYRGETFGAPRRNDADTVWMKEREIAAQYRARFDAARHATGVLDKLYTEAAAGRDITERAWLIAVANPRVTLTPLTRWDREQARDIYKDGERLSMSFAPNRGIRPLGEVDRQNPRPGLRRWIAPNTAVDDVSRWRESWISIHFDGSVSIAAAVGAHKYASGQFHEGWRVSSLVIEGAVADLMGLTRAVGYRIGAVDYEVRLGIEWAGEHPIVLHHKEQFIDQDTDAGAIPLHRYISVETTVEVRDSDDQGYLQQVQLLAQDAINQGGVMHLQLIVPKLDGGVED